MSRFIRISKLIFPILLIIVLTASCSDTVDNKPKESPVSMPSINDEIYSNIQVKNYRNDLLRSIEPDNLTTISILGTADLHGYVYPLNYYTGGTKYRGIAKVSSYVKLLKSHNPNVMLVDAGDTTQGTPFVYYYNVIDTDTIHPMMKALRAMGYEAWVLGNHEFEYGKAWLDRVVNDAASEGITTLSANLYKRDNSNYVKPYMIKEFNVNGKTIKIGILGLTVKTQFTWGNEEEYEGLKFVYTVNDAKKWVPIIKGEGADIVIAVVHAGWGEVNAIASSVEGIDAILFGHLHLAIPQSIVKNPAGEDVLITEPRAYGELISQIDISVDSSGNLVSLTTMNVEIANSFEPDTALLDLMKPYQDKVLEYLNTTLCTSTGTFPAKYSTTKPTAIIDLINKAQIKASGCQLSITATKMSTSVVIPSGEVKVRNIMYAYPYDEDFLIGIKMTGLQLKKWMEHSAKYYKQVVCPSDPVVKDPVLDASYSKLDILYGVTYTIDLTEPLGKRIKNLKYNGKPINDQDIFTVAINSPRFEDNGGFMSAAGIDPNDPDIQIYNSSKTLGFDGLMVNILMQYIKDEVKIEPEISNNWSISTVPVR